MDPTNPIQSPVARNRHLRITPSAHLLSKALSIRQNTGTRALNAPRPHLGFIIPAAEYSKIGIMLDLTIFKAISVSLTLGADVSSGDFTHPWHVAVAERLQDNTWQGLGHVAPGI